MQEDKNYYQEYERQRQERLAINKAHMEKGVIFIDIENTYIGEEVIIEEGAKIYPNTYIEGKSYISGGAIIGPNTRIVDSKIGRNTRVESSTILESRLGEMANIGPYAYIRPNSTIGNQVKIGNFVEIKNSKIGEGTKISHLTYVGDADVGRGVNFGCGTVIVNYDGVNKHRTTIDDHAFIGCNSNLVAPVKIGKAAYTAAGSTITEDVPAYSLAIARKKQEIKSNWVKEKTDSFGGMKSE